MLRHLRLERGVRAFAAELRRLDEQARAAATRASLTVRVETGKGPRLAPPAPNAWSLLGTVSYASPPRGHTEGGNGRDFVALPCESRSGRVPHPQPHLIG